jgi:hypothetical protein
LGLLVLLWRRSEVLGLAGWRVVVLLRVARRRRVVLLFFGVLGYDCQCELDAIVTLTRWRSWIGN